MIPLRQLLQSYGISQRQAAKLIGANPGTFRRYFYPEESPRYRDLSQDARAKLEAALLAWSEQKGS